MSKQLYTVSKEGLEYLCGLINKIITLPSDVIDNLNLADNTTFSSTKINALINQTLLDANTHAEELCNALTKLTCKKTTVQPTLDNSELNIIYLFSSDGNAPYEQYLKISDTELIDMGSTSINLNDYLTVTDAVNAYAKKVDLDTWTTEVTNIKSDFTTHKNDTDIHTSADEKASYIKKTDIVTTIDSISTNDTVPSAKSVYDNIKTKNTIQPTGTITNYSSVFDWAVNNIGATCGYEGNMFDDCPLNHTWGILVCIGTKVESGLKVLFCTNYNKDIYTRTIQRRQGVNGWVETSWQRLCNTSVDDVPLKTLKNSSDINSDAVITYIVKNGMCSVSVNTVSSTKMSTGNITLTTGLPIPTNTSCWYSLCTNSNATNAPLQNLLLRIDSSGNLIAYKGTDNINYFGSFSYPVKES